MIMLALSALIATVSRLLVGALAGFTTFLAGIEKARAMALAYQKSREPVGSRARRPRS